MLKIGVVPQRQSAGEMGSDPPGVGLSNGSHHMQFAASDALLAVHLRLERGQIVTGADDDSIKAMGCAAACGQRAWFDVNHGGGVPDIDPVLILKPVR